MSPNVSISPAALEGVTPEQGRALAALLAGQGVTAAAAAAGVDRRTVTRWRTSNAQFVSLYRSLKAELFEATRAELLVLAPKAVRTIKSLLTRRTTPPGVRLRAAVAVLESVAAMPQDGSADLDDVENEIGRRERARPLARILAGRDDPYCIST
jgi:hypothetical protein